MLELVLLLVPVFGLVALGYGAALLGLIGERANDGLTSYLFVIGAPALIFKLLTAAETDASPLSDEFYPPVDLPSFEDVLALAWANRQDLAAAAELPARVMFDIEARNFIRCFETDDHKEAVAAFKEKRKPVFKGR